MIPDSRRRAGLVLLGLVVAAVGCRRTPPAPPAPPPPKVTVVHPVPQQVQPYREYTGYLDAVETVSIRSRVRGFLQKVHFKEGSVVKKGDLLYEIDPREFRAAVERAQADQSKAETQVELTRAEEDRARGLVQTRAITEEEFQTRVAARKSAEASVRQAKAAVRVSQLDLDFTRIEAPLAGRISRTLVTEGNLVGFNEPTLLTTIVSTGSLYVYFDAPERDMVEAERETLGGKAETPAETAATLRVELGVSTEDGYPHAGAIDFRENKVDIGTGTIRIRGKIEDPAPILYPGLYARVRVPKGPARAMVVIPEAALQTGQAGRFVLTVTADDTVEPRPVTVGPKVAGGLAIEAGLTPADRVIVVGMQKARPGGPVAPHAPEAAAKR